MMTQEKLIQAMRLRLPDAKDASDEMLLAHLTDAKALLLAMTWRQTLPEALESAQVRLASILFNRMGMEGESEHVEGDVRRAAGIDASVHGDSFSPGLLATPRPLHMPMPPSTASTWPVM